MSTISEEPNITAKVTAKFTDKLTALAIEQFDVGYAAGYEDGRDAVLAEQKTATLVDNT
jgi:hypothetical protein